MLGPCLLGGDRQVGDGGGDSAVLSFALRLAVVEWSAQFPPHHHDEATEERADKTGVNPSPGAGPASDIANAPKTTIPPGYQGRDLGRQGGFPIYRADVAWVNRCVGQDRRCIEPRRLEI